MLSEKQKNLLETFGLGVWAKDERASKVYQLLIWIEKKNPSFKQINILKKRLGVEWKV